MIWIFVSIVIIIFLIVISAFFSSSEMAFVSVNKAVIVDKARKGDKRAQTLERLLKQPENVISAIVIGNNLVNIFASVLAGFVATFFLGSVGIGIATALMFFFIIVFSEATPKALAIHNEQLALRFARPVALVTKLLHPFVTLLKLLSNGLIYLVGGKTNGTRAVTEKEIMAMMRLGEEEGTIETDEREMVNEVFEFDETRAYEIYTPKDKIAFLNNNDTVGTLIQQSIKTGLSRFPVYRKNHDDVIGMVHVKDTLHITDNSTPLTHIIRPILKIHSHMKVDDVLRAMKRQKTHLALLQDQKGKTLGLVTIEDLVEEIFGDIVDEHDKKLS